MTLQLGIVGDSISTYEGCNPAEWNVYYQGKRPDATGVLTPGETWWGILAKALNAQVAVNASYSGSMVAGCGFPAAWSPQRIAALGEEPLDYLFVFMGINDYGWGGSENQAKGRSVAAPPEAIAATSPAITSNAAPHALEEFSESYRHLLEKLHAAHPEATIWCCGLVPARVAGAATSTFTYSLRGIELSAYNQAIRNAVTTLQTEGAPVHFCDAARFGREYEAGDGTHPTGLGMQQLATLMLHGMGKGAAAPLSLEDLPRATRTCTRPTCVDCPYIFRLGNNWHCVCLRENPNAADFVLSYLQCI